MGGSTPRLISNRFCWGPSGQCFWRSWWGDKSLCTLTPLALRYRLRVLNGAFATAGLQLRDRLPQRALQLMVSASRCLTTSRRVLGTGVWIKGFLVPALQTYVTSERCGDDPERTNAWVLFDSIAGPLSVVPRR